MRFPVRLLLLACLVLSGCWKSQGLLLDTSRGYAGLQATQYQATGGGTSLLMSMGGGWYLRQSGEATDLLFVERLQGDVLAIASADASCRDAPATCTWQYAPVRLSGDVLVQIGTDNPEARALAQAQGASCTPDSNNCYFNSRSGLVSALNQQARIGPTTGTWRPIGF